MDSERDGIVQVGEVPVVIRRDAAVEADHSQAYRSGAEQAYQTVLVFVDLAEASAPPFTDLRPYQHLRTFLKDRIMEAMADGTT